MVTTAVIVLGVLTGVLGAIPLAFFVTRGNQLNRPSAPPVALSSVPSVGEPVADPVVGARPNRSFSPVSLVEVVGGFPGEPRRFVGRAEVMAAAGSALAPDSGSTAVVFQGMAGVGKTTCAVELAYRHQRAFLALVFWSAPGEPDQFGDALRQLAVALEAHLADDGLVMVEEIAPLARLETFLPTLTTVFADAGLLLVLDNLDTLLTPDGQWRDRRWALLISALTGHQGSSRVILTSRIDRKSVV